MGVRVAYGRKSKINDAITSGTIPKDTLIITSDGTESELYFYDTDGSLKTITERKTFETISEAQAWIRLYDCSGNIISVHNGSDYIPYIVSGDGRLIPIDTDGINIDDIKVIDGGRASGL